MTEKIHFCARCKAKRPVKLIRGFNGARDRLECVECGRRWPIGRTLTPAERSWSQVTNGVWKHWNET